MEKTVLITGNQNPLKTALLTTCLNQGRHVVVTLEKGQNEELPENERLIKVEYTRRSFLSPRKLFLECRSYKVDIQHLVIIHGILGQSDVLQGFQNSIIERKIDEDMKGLVFLLKESISYFNKRKSGSINVVVHNSGPKTPGPLEALLAGGLESLVSSLFTYYGFEDYVLRGYNSREHDYAEFAEYILSNIDNNRISGKWLNYRNRSRIFPFGLVT